MTDLVKKLSIELHHLQDTLSGEYSTYYKSFSMFTAPEVRPSIDWYGFGELGGILVKYDGRNITRGNNENYINDSIINDLQDIYSDTFGDKLSIHITLQRLIAYLDTVRV